VQGLVKRVDVISFVRAWWDTGAHIVCFQESWADCRGELSSGALKLFLDDACKAVGLRGVPDLLLASNTLGPGYRAGVGILVLRCPDTGLVLIMDEVHSTPDGRVLRCEYGGAGTGCPWSTLTGRLQLHAVGSCLLFPAMLASAVSLPRFSYPWYNHARLGVWSW
jgi:hypothetical protein